MHMKEGRDPQLINRFVSLTRKALSEEESDRFLEDLLERDGLMRELVEKGPVLSPEEAGICLFQEGRVLARLEEERTKLLKDMEDLSINRKAVTAYVPKFPFPSMPVFFDRTG
jgi:hypothetical protein